MDARVNPIDDLVARLETLGPEARAETIEKGRAATDGMLWVPNIGPQTAAYFSPADELLFGGEAGGGKTDLLLGVAVNEHMVSQVFRLQHNDRVAIVRRLAELIAGTPQPERSQPPGYNGSNHIWQSKVPIGRQRRRPIIEFGALSEPGAWEHYQGRPADAKLWDELSQFLRQGYTTVNAWNRTVTPGQRSRVIAASNPPTTADGLWLVDYWAPWLDDRHLNPARDGELRYYATVDGREDVEVDASWRGSDKNGLVLKPRSRTFIRSSLADNPDLAETNYASMLQALPKHLRDALADGKFRAAFDDDAWQVIPTDWIIAANQRWEKRNADFLAGLAEKGPMEAMGVDCAGGTQPAEGERPGVGTARMVMAPRHGTFFDTLRQAKAGTNLRDPREAAAQIFYWVRDDAQVNLDNTGGWGSGPAGILASNRHPLVLCVFSQESTERARAPHDTGPPDAFVNKRAEYYWLLREALDPVNGDDLALPPDRELLAELSAVKWRRVRWKGQNAVQLEPKDHIEGRLGRSPDKADAVVLAWAERDALAGFGERDAFHPASTRGESRRGHQRAKEKSRSWRNRGGG